MPKKFDNRSIYYIATSCAGVLSGPVVGADLHFVYIGSLAPHKGVHVLIDAFNVLPERTRLTICGDLDAFPDYVANLRQRARHPGITLTGRVSHGTVWNVLREADALIQPSLVYETASLVIREAHAVGTVVVASDIGALRETALTGSVLFPPGDVAALRDILLRLIEQPDLLRELRAKIRPVRTVDAQVSEIETVYRQVVAAL